MPQTLVAQVQLLPSPEQAVALEATLRQANAAAGVLSGLAWERRAFRRYDLHKIAYHDVRESSGLSAQVVVRLAVAAAERELLQEPPQLRRQRLHLLLGHGCHLPFASLPFYDIPHALATQRSAALLSARLLRAEGALAAGRLGVAVAFLIVTEFGVGDFDPGSQPTKRRREGCEASCCGSGGG